MKKRRIRRMTISIMLCLAMIIMTFAGMPMPKSQAVISNSYEIHIAGLEGSGNNSTAKFTFKADCSILELNGYKTSGPGYEYYGSLYGIYYDGNLKIILKGDNEITAGSAQSFYESYGIYVLGNLTIEGEGTLNLDVQKGAGTTVTDYAYGIYCGDKLTINGSSGFSLTSKSGNVAGTNNVTYAYGIFCRTYQQTGGTVTAKGGNIETGTYNFSYGAYVSDSADQNGVKISGGTLTASSGKVAGADSLSVGIRFNPSVTLSKGTVQGKADVAADGNSTGVQLIKNLTLTGGSLSGSGTTAGSSKTSYGITTYEPDGCTLKAGKLTGTAGLATEVSCGIECVGFTIPSNGTTQVVAKGLDASYGNVVDRNYGINAYDKNCKDILVNGGSVTATAGSAKEESSGICFVTQKVGASGKGKITARSGDCDVRCEGIVCKELVCADQAVIDAECGASVDAFGIFVINDVTVNGGTLKAKAGAGSANSCGIWSNLGESFLVSDGTVELEGGKGGFYAGQGYGYDFNLKLTGGRLTAKAADGPALTSKKDNLIVTAPAMKGSTYASGTALENASTYNASWKYAVLFANSVVSFDANGGSGTMDPVSVKIGSNYTLPECGFTAPDGKEFAGWTVGGKTREAGQSIKISEDVTVKAKWQKIPITYSGMLRLYNPNSGEHFYTASEEEKDTLTGLGWIFEGIAWTAPSRSNTPVYRLYNPNAGDHHYTPSEQEKNDLVAVGWQYEGIGWYSDDAEGVGLYRLYNPNAQAGAHHYTPSEQEKNDLIDAGWQYEGIGWYGVKSGSQ